MAKKTHKRPEYDQEKCFKETEMIIKTRQTHRDTKDFKDREGHTTQRHKTNTIKIHTAILLGVSQTGCSMKRGM